MTENDQVTSGNSKTRWIQALVVFYILAVLLGALQVVYFRHNIFSLRKTTSAFLKTRTQEQTIAVVPIYGIISGGGSSLKLSSTDNLVKRLKALSEDEEVKAVVLRINSPGGSVGAVQEIYDSVLALKRSGKKVVVSMGEIAASGGYYIAAAADKIIAEPGTLTGSIGVILQVGNFQELFKKIGVNMEAIKSAEHKDIGSPFRHMTDEEKAIFQSIIDDTYGQFVDAVAQGRKIDRAKVLALADGRIYSGSQAKAAGLIDDFGNIDAAISKAAELAGITGKPKVTYEDDPFQKIFSILSQDSMANFWSKQSAKAGVSFAYIWEYDI